MHSRPARRTRIGWRWNLLGAGTFAVLIHCAGGPAPKNTQAPPPSKLEAIVWTPCNLMVEGQERLADCARVDLPRDHGSASLETVPIGIKRLRAPRQPSRGQLWFLDGGPGDSGVADLGKLEFLSKEVGDLDLYTLDPRGAGQSALLECPEQQAKKSKDGREITEAEWDPCIAYLQQHRAADLAVFTTTQTAKDLGALIEHLRTPDQKLFVWGVSYGTYLANRYLQLFPQQPDGVILDGLVPADWNFVNFDQGLDQTGRKLLQHCGEVQDCASRFGPDPVARATDLFQKMENGHCGKFGLTPRLARLVAGHLLMGGSDYSQYIPAFFYRVDRCAKSDRKAIIYMFNHAFDDKSALASERATHSAVLNHHIILSELWPTPAPDPKAFHDALNGYLMSTEVSANLSALASRWPRSSADPLDGQFAKYDGPMLMLHGGMDPTNQVEALESLRAAFNGAHQTFVVFPHSQHVTLNERKCALSIYAAFLKDPMGTVDSSCVSDTHATEFHGDPEKTQFLFGTADMWGDAAAAGTSAK